MDEFRRAALKSVIVTVVDKLRSIAPAERGEVVRRLQWHVQAGAGGRIVGAAEGYSVKGKIE